MRTQTEEKKRAILDATIEEFEAKGFASARIEDIAKKAGVAKGTVYNYFESKEALLMGLADELGDLIRGISSAL
ncbi:MAG: helix-turn-helix domain-containing protein [Sutterella seckii]